MIRRRDKKAWLRIVEAFLAILIITSVLLFTVTKIPKRDRSEDIYETERAILRQIALNEELRQEVLQGQTTETESFIREIVPNYWNFTIAICEIEEVCGMPSYIGDIERNIYADDILISSTLQQYQPKKLKLFVWEK